MSRGRPRPRDRLEALLSPELVAALEDHVRELVAERLAEWHGGGGRDWYTLEEAAELLGCSYDAARMRVKRGRLEARPQGRRVYVSADSLERLR